ncbi:hypothetical protein ACVWZM_005560 [Bradyrhizobium sp. USDA 4501]
MAQKCYRDAQHGIGLVRARDLSELAVKSMASMAFEGAALGDAKAQYRLRDEKQIVAWSVAFDLILLAGNPVAASASNRGGRSPQGTDPALEAIAKHQQADADHNAAITATDATEYRSEAYWQADDHQGACCHAEADAGWDLARTIPTTLGGVAAVLEYVKQYEDKGEEWPNSDCIGREGWHYQLRQMMATAAVNLA